jgi:F-type H+-transporting ATPase subunit alpha
VKSPKSPNPCHNPPAPLRPNLCRHRPGKRQLFTPQLPHEIGTIATVSTGIAKVSGLPSVGFEELLAFPGEVFGIAFNLDPDEIGVVLLGDYWQLHAGDAVERTGRVMDVAVGDGLLGRVIDPLGRPLDGLGR